MQDLEKAILKTIIYFDIFNYPLTLPEIHQWLGMKIDSGDLKNILEQSEFLRNKISRKEGFYFLNGRENIIEIRKQRNQISQRKIKKAKKICQWLLFFNPFIKGIAICNDLGYLNAHGESDIDLFIITRKNRIWLARFFLTLPLKIFGLRPTKKNKKDKICLSFFIAEDNLNLEKIKLEDKEGAPDIYFIYWLVQLLPIYGEENIWQEFYQANDWLKNYLPNFEFKELKEKIKLPKISMIIRNFFRQPRLCSINGFFEKFYKFIQLKILPRELKEKANQNTDIMITDKILKLHCPDKRELYQTAFLDKIKQSL